MMLHQVIAPAIENTPRALQDTLAGKLRRLRLFPAHMLTARTGIAARMHARRTRRSESQLTRRGHNALLSQRSHEAIPQDAADLVYLYDQVRKHRPARCIEFGSGQSTIFIAEALHDLGAGHLWSLDADAEWLANSRRSLPMHLRRHVTFVHSPAEVHLDYGVPAFRYTMVPGGPWDFVLIDGPALTAEVQLSTDLLTLPLAPHARGMIDHRWRSATLAKEHAGGRFSLRYMPSLESFALSAP